MPEPHFQEDYSSRQERLANTPDTRNRQEIFSPEGRSRRMQEFVSHGREQYSGVVIPIGDRLQQFVSSEKQFKTFEGLPFSETIKETGPQDWRARNQSVAQKFGNVLPNFGTTALTAFADSTIGTVFGALNYATGGSFTDNAWTNLMMDAQDSVREAFPLYTTAAEEEALWHEKIFGGDGKWANWWADVLINQGFTFAMVASGAVAAGAIRGILGARMGVNALKATRGAVAAQKSGELKTFSAAVQSGNMNIANLNRQLIKQAGQLKNMDYATQLLSSAHGSMGYARIEALGYSRELMQDFEGQLQQQQMSLVEEEANRLQKENPELSPAAARIMAEKSTAPEIEERREVAKELVAAQRNITFGLNLMYLTLTNQAMFGRVFSGNYGAQKATLNKALAPKAGIQAVRENPKLLRDGLIKKTQGKFTRAQKPAWLMVKNPTIQFFEESFLHINRESTGDFYRAQYDPEATDDMESMRQTYLNTLVDTFFDVDNWESGMIGFFGGALGALGPVTKGGRVTGFGMHGGIWDAARAMKGTQEQQIDDMRLEAVNKMLADGNLQEMYRSAVRRSHYEDGAKLALVDGDRFQYENAENASFINDLILFDQMGLREEFLEYTSAGSDITAGEAREMFAQTKDLQGNIYEQPVDIFEGLSDREIETLLQNTNKDLVDYSKRVLELKDSIDILASQRGLPKPAADELIYLAASIENMADRLKGVTQELPLGIKEVADTLVETIKDKNIKEYPKIEQELNREVDIAAEGSRAERERYLELVDNYVNLHQRINRYGELYDSLQTDEGVEDFMNNEVESQRELVRKINEELLATRSLEDQIQNLSPELRAIFDRVSVSETVDVDGEPVTRVFLGELELNLAVQKGDRLEPTGETARFIVEGIDGDGRLQLRKVTSLEGDATQERQVSENQVTMDGEGRLFGLEGVHGYTFWEPVVSGEQARVSTLGKQLAQEFRQEVNTLTETLETQNNEIEAATRFRESIRKKLNSITNRIKQASAQTKKAFEIEGVNVTHKKFKSLLKQTLSPEEYQRLKVDTASEITLSVYDLENVVSHLDTTIEQLEKTRNTSQDRLNTLKNVQTTVPNIPQLESTIKAIENYISRSQSTLENISQARASLQNTIDDLKETLDVLGVKREVIEDRIREKYEALDAAREELESYADENSPVGELSSDFRLEGEIRDLKNELSAILNEQITAEKELDLTQSSLDKLPQQMEQLKQAIEGSKDMARLHRKIVNTYRKLIQNTQTESTKPKPEGQVEQVASQEDYEETTVNDRMNNAPRERFVGTTFSLQRTTNRQQEFVEDPQFYEPQLRFQEAINNWDGTKKPKLRAYTLAQFKEAFADKLTDAQMNKLASETRANYSVYLVLTDSKGNPIEADSYYREGHKTIAFGYMSDLLHPEEGYVNKRISGHELVDLEKDGYTEAEYAEVAKKFDETIRQEVLTSEQPVLFDITGVTPGVVARQKDGDYYPPAPASKVFKVDKQFKGLKIHVPTGSEIVTNDGQIYGVRPGFVYVEHNGLIIGPDRAKLSQEDINKVVGAIQYALHHKTEEARRQVFDVINTYTFFTNASAQRNKDYESFSRFFIPDDFQSVVIGNDFVSASDILAGDTQALETFLQSKMYNVDTKRLETNQFNDIEKIDVTRDSEGKISNIDLSIRRRKDYKQFLLSDVDNTPKLQFRVAPQKTGVEALESPQRFNRSFRYAPLGTGAQEAISSEAAAVSDKTTEDSLEKAVQGKTTTKKAIPDKPSDPDEAAIDRMAEASKKAVEDYKRESSVETTEDQPAFQDPAVQRTTDWAAELAKKSKTQNNYPETPSKEDTEQAQDDSRYEGEDFFFTTTSESININTPVNFLAEYTRFRQMFPDIDVFPAGVAALKNRDARLSTTGDYVKVLVNANSSTPGVLYHEGFHIFNLLFNSTNNRIALYDETREFLKGRKIKVDGKTVIGDKLSDKQAEEYLAEQFRVFMLVGKNKYKFPKATSQRQAFFNKLWNGLVKFLNKYFGTRINTREAESDPQLILNAFNQIAEGRFEVEKLGALNSVNVNRIGNFDQATSDAMIRGINWLVFNNAFRDTKTSGAYTLQNFKSELPRLHERAKVSIHKKIDRLKEENKTTEFFDQILNNWDEVIAAHKTFLTQYNLEVDSLEDVRLAEDRGRDTTNWFESNLINPREQVEIPLKLMLASISERDADGRLVRIADMPQTADYNKVIGQLHNDLKNLNTFPEMIRALESRREVIPYYDEILKRLKTDGSNPRREALSKDELRLQKAFENQFAKAESEYTTLVLADNGKSYLVSSISSTIQNKVIDTWKSSIKVADSVTNRIFDLVGGRHKLNPSGKIQIGNLNKAVSELTLSDIRGQQNTLAKQNHPRAQNLGIYKEYLSHFGIKLDNRVRGTEAVRRAVEEISKQVQQKFKAQKPVFAEDIFNKDVFKFNKELRQLAELQSHFEEYIFDGQYRNEDGQWEHSIRLKHHIDKVLDAINNNTLPDSMQPFDGNKGNYLTYGSKWLQESSIGKAILRALGEERGEKTSFNKLKPGDYQVIHAESILNGVFPFLRSAERKLEVGFDFGSNYVSVIDSEMFVAELRDYLKSEIVYTLAMNHIPEFNKFTTGDVNKELNFFKDLVPPEVKYDLQNQPARDKSEFISVAEQIVEEHMGQINVRLRDYVKGLRNTLRERYVKAKLFDTHNKNKQTYYNNAISAQTLTRLKIPFKQETRRGQPTQVLSLDSVHRLMDTLNFYYLTSYIEQTKLFTGAINTFLKQKDGRLVSDLYKRTNSITSTAGHSSNDVGYTQALNRLYPRMDNQLSDRDFSHSNVYRDFVYKDVEVESPYLKEYRSLIGDKANAYAKQTENDAAGWMTLDGLRSYTLRTTGQWGEAQERTWQYQSQLLLQKFVEKGYITEQQYREVFKEHLPTADINFTGRMFYEGNRLDFNTLTPFSIKKPISVGSFANTEVEFSGKKQITKTAISTLLPSDHINNDKMVEFMWDLMQNGMDFVFPQSAKKAEILGNNEGELPSLYKEDGTFNLVSELVDEGYTTELLSWDSIGDQLDIDPAGHGVTTDSSQKRSLMYIDSFEQGNVVEGREGLAEQYDEYVTAYNSLINRRLENLVDQLGLENTPEGFRAKDMEKFVDFVTSELQRRRHPDNALAAVQMVFNVATEVNDGLQLFDSMPNKRQFINLLQGLVRNKAIHIKVNGDMLVQEASTGYEALRPNPTKSNPLLKFYRVENGKVLPAQAMMSLPQSWIPIVEKFEGVTFEDKLENFNTAVTTPGTEVYERFKPIREVMANRIPGQHLNSIEALEIIKFVSPVGGPRIILPTEIVTKSGSDFDIDKLTTYFNNTTFDKDGLPVYEQFLTDKEALWEQYGEKLRKSKRGRDYLKKNNIDIDTISSIEAFNEAVQRNLKNDSHLRSIFNSDSLQLIYEELSEGLKDLTKEEFMERSLYDLNSEGAVQNKIHELSKDVLLHPENFASLITPNSSDSLTHLADKYNPAQEAVQNHKLLEPLFSMGVAFNMFEGASVLGIEANNTTAHARQQRHPIRITTPAFQILSPRFKNQGGYFLGHKHAGPSKKELISENNGSKVTGSVDVAKESRPAIIRLNLTTATSMSQSLLNRMGTVEQAPLGLEEVAQLYTSPIVQEYSREARVHEAEFLRNKDLDDGQRAIVNRLLTGDSTSKFYSKDLAETKAGDRRFLFEEVQDYIRLALDKESTSAQKADRASRVASKIEQVKNIPHTPHRELEMFLYYQEIAKVINRLQQLTKQDASLAKDRYTTILQKEALERIKESGIFERADIENLIETSYLSSFNKAHEYSKEMFDQYHIDGASTEFGNFMNSMIRQMYHPLTNRPIDKAAQALNKIHNAAVTYILHTTEVGQHALNNRYQELMKGTKDNLSLPAKLGNLKAYLYNNRDSVEVQELYKNPAIQELVPVIKEYNLTRDKQHEIDYLKKFNRKYTVEESNAIVNGISDLIAHPSEVISQIGRDLVDLSLVQSGAQISPFSFFEILPAHEYYARVTGIMKKYFKTSGIVLTEHAKDEIFANLAYDNLVVPKVSRKEGKLSDQNRILTINAPNQNRLFDYVKRVVKDSRTQQWENRLFKKIREEDGATVYQVMNTKGDPHRMFEAYSDYKKSGITSNNVTELAPVSLDDVERPAPPTSGETLETGSATQQPDIQQTTPTTQQTGQTTTQEGRQTINVFAGTGDNAHLSNFAKRPFEMPDVANQAQLKSFDSVEQYFQWRKAVFAGDYDTANKIYNANTASQARVLGRSVKGLDKEGWDSISSGIMKDAMTESFSQNPSAFERLLATGDAVITHKHKGVEQDSGRFSKLLMEVRDELQGTFEGYLQRDTETTAKPDPKLNERISTFLEAIGVTHKSVDQIVDSLGHIVGDKNQGAVALANVVDKTVQVIENRADRLTLPEEAAHFYIEMLPNNDSLLRAMMNQVHNYEIYEEVKSNYGDVYGQDAVKLKKEAAAKIISRKIAGEAVSSIKQRDKQASNWLRGLWNRIKQWFGAVNNDPFAKSAHNILNQRLKNLNNIVETPAATSTAEYAGQDYLQSRYTDRRLSVQDEVAAAHKAEERRLKTRQNRESMETRLPKASSETTQQNKQELKKVSERDLAIQDIFNNFDTYFPAYSHFSNAEKLAFAESMDFLEIIC